MFQVISHSPYTESASFWATLGEAVENYINLVQDHALKPVDNARVFQCEITGELVVLEIVEVSDDPR